MKAGKEKHTKPNFPVIAAMHLMFTLLSRHSVPLYYHIKVVDYCRPHWLDAEIYSLERRCF